MRITKLESENDAAKRVTRCIFELTEVERIDCPFTPRCGVVGDDFLHLATEIDADRLSDMGYYHLQPEGMAMQLMRLAWVCAHEEMRQTTAPFDGDLTPPWMKP